MNLNEDNVSLFHSLAPVLTEHGDAICAEMYDILFQETPAARRFFSLEFFRAGESTSGAVQERLETLLPEEERAKCPFADDAEGDLSNACPAAKRAISNQARRLAGSILDFCINIHDLDKVQREIHRIAATHVSRGVQPAHYGLVGVALLDAVKKVLGPAASDEVLDCLGETYEFLSAAFIQVEKEMRGVIAKKPGGWVGYRDFQVTNRVGTANGSVAISMKGVDGMPAVGYIPGQSVCIRWEDATYGTLMKNVPLDASGVTNRSIAHEEYAFSIKSGSTIGFVTSTQLLFEAAQVGMILEVSPPVGGFTYKPDSGGAPNQHSFSRRGSIPSLLASEIPRDRTRATPLSDQMSPRNLISPRRTSMKGAVASAAVDNVQPSDKFSSSSKRTSLKGSESIYELGRHRVESRSGGDSLTASFSSLSTARRLSCRLEEAGRCSSIKEAFDETLLEAEVSSSGGNTPTVLTPIQATRRSTLGSGNIGLSGAVQSPLSNRVVTPSLGNEQGDGNHCDSFSLSGRSRRASLNSRRLEPIGIGPSPLTPKARGKEQPKMAVWGDQLASSLAQARVVQADIESNVTPSSDWSSSSDGSASLDGCTAIPTRMRSNLHLHIGEQSPLVSRRTDPKVRDDEFELTASVDELLSPRHSTESPKPTQGSNALCKQKSNLAQFSLVGPTLTQPCSDSEPSVSGSSIDSTDYLDQ